jgi:hypothetical protein
MSGWQWAFDDIEPSFAFLVCSYLTDLCDLARAFLKAHAIARAQKKR